ncbi:MAG: hypothetical protein RLZZ198_662 [Bacteroidota bacterium]|jgi:hypothetical protein
MPATKSGLAKVAVQCSADIFVVKMASFAKPNNVKSMLKNKNNSGYESKCLKTQSERKIVFLNVKRGDKKPLRHGGKKQGVF